ncbi:hypothetical protein POV27_14080 [Aureisphaera galaxeae]|uniref:hypothetical protein n=1 Tax=Aureisphaera galaxeae TaxID=1538023 RepID=UPI0023501A6F|nr:hypothetical protein [Aureisphaera galaxeae]MDC8005186.1 hypothetical protein [Aureisphaera galaxeae]
MKKSILFLLLAMCFGIAKAQQNQNEILQQYASGKYAVYKVNAKKKFEKVKKTWPLEISSEGGQASKVLVKRSGILDENFEVDVPGYPAYFGYKNYRLTFLKNYAAYYEWNGKQQAKVKYIFVKEGGSFGKSFTDTNTEIASYAKAIFANQSSARADVKKEKKALAEAERQANSLEGKSVAKIEVEWINPPQKISHFSKSIDFGIVATLKDGSQLKTPNLGGKLPWSDFEFSNVGCSNTTERVNVEEDASKIPNDKVVVRATSRYHPSLKAQKSLATTNDISIQVSRNGFYGADRARATGMATVGASQRGGNGHSLTVKVKGGKNKQTGMPMNKIQIYDESERKVIARYKLSPATQLILNVNGGKGQWGSDGSSASFPNGDDGGNGGNGGTITILKDPSVTSMNITVNNKGGAGGAGGKRYNVNGTSGSTGRSGSTGSNTTKTQSVTLDF